ncbi:NAD(+) kinase [Psychromonas ingrahamii 37]|uniref:NAD kinase n=1 Tax=Psychromonas ingrahamii (strain DSM 17664 / CCUG 51855 / 37) TaxID=357804 RepID=A1STE2_PSYIN|nr:NAD(+) kinase [Psychromonas ingrahamii]ABM02757.1 NAD(+) kinase [Psychromonas ingrahamii 37]
MGAQHDNLIEFKTIGLIAKTQHPDAKLTLLALYRFLKAKGVKLVVDQRIADELPMNGFDRADLVGIGSRCDLAIVIGGDGYMLGAARVLSRFDIAVIGVNRGNLGFLTDLDPDNFEQPLEQVLLGNYQIEKRFLLEAQVHRHGDMKSSNTAVNEAVLHPDKIAHMLEFEVYVNDDFMLNQRADGLIIATPTGSTAYSLSGGGPILTPNLDAISLLPMFPHTLNSRPIVIDANSCVRLKIAQSNKSEMQISCDSHVNLSVLPGDEIIIKKSQDQLKLVHPKNYNYFHVLQNKLGWGNKLY